MFSQQQKKTLFAWKKILQWCTCRTQIQNFNFFLNNKPDNHNDDDDDEESECCV